MSKRAALIITDCDQVETTDWCAEAGKHQGYAWPSEQLLADLDLLCAYAPRRARLDVRRAIPAFQSEYQEAADEIEAAAARVRALLPGEDS